MMTIYRLLALVAAIFLAACNKPSPDFKRTVPSPSGSVVGHVWGFQPRGTIDGHLTMSFASKGSQTDPQLVFGHLLNVEAGWLDDHHFAIVYDVLDARQLQSPLYPTGEIGSEVQIISCNRSFLNCGSLIEKLRAGHSIKIGQFPEGTWPQDQ